MTRTTALRSIDAPIERVFDAVAHIESFSKAIPHITQIDFLTERRVGVGTRFRETREMGRRRAQTELEVTEYLENEMVRIISESGGTVWDTTFRVSPSEFRTELTMVLEARPSTMMARLTVPLLSPMITRAIERDLDAVKDYCEAR